jgi:O-antigen ligase
MVALRRTGGLSPWVTVSLALCCLMVGVLSGIDPKYGIEAALGLMFVVVAMRDVTLGFVLFTIASFLDVASSSGSFSGTKVIGLVLFVSWMARVATRRGSDLGAFMSDNAGLTWSLIAMLVWAGLSFTWAYSPGTALSGAVRYALVMMLIPIAFGAIRTREQAIWVLTAFAAGSVLSGLYGFLHSAPASLGAGRLTGGVGDANYEAACMAAAIPIVVSLLGVFRNSARMKLAGLIALGMLFVFLVETLSREGLVALGVVMIFAVVFGGRWRRQATQLLVVGAAVTVGYFVFLAPASSLARVTDTGTSGRSTLWTVALRVIKAHPLTGVGNDNFVLVSHNYINQPGAIQALYVVNTPKVTHNTLLEAAADLGIPGLLTLLAVLGFCLGAAVRAAWIFERTGDRDMELMSRALVLALIAVLTTDMFIAGGYAKFLWILLAMCPVMLRLARHGAAAQMSLPAVVELPRAGRWEAVLPPGGGVG